MRHSSLYILVYSVFRFGLSRRYRRVGYHLLSAVCGDVYLHNRRLYKFTNPRKALYRSYVSPLNRRQSLFSVRSFRRRCTGKRVFHFRQIQAEVAYGNLVDKKLLGYAGMLVTKIPADLLETVQHEFAHRRFRVRCVSHS